MLLVDALLVGFRDVDPTLPTIVRNSIACCDNGAANCSSTTIAVATKMLRLRRVPTPRVCPRSGRRDLACAAIDDARLLRRRSAFQGIGIDSLVGALAVIEHVPSVTISLFVAAAVHLTLCHCRCHCTVARAYVASRIKIRRRSLGGLCKAQEQAGGDSSRVNHRRRHSMVSWMFCIGCEKRIMMIIPTVASSLFQVAPARSSPRVLG